MRDRPGRQFERTELAWERSTLSLIAAAALLLFRQVGPAWARIALAAGDVALALFVIWLGRRRGARLRAGLVAGGTVPEASREVLLASIGAVVVAAATVLLVVVPS